MPRRTPGATKAQSAALGAGASQPLNLRHTSTRSGLQKDVVHYKHSKSEEPHSPQISRSACLKGVGCRPSSRFALSQSIEISAGVAHTRFTLGAHAEPASTLAGS